MYIAPNSTVRVLRGVNIDSDYQHTVRFTNRDAQYDVLSAKTKFTFTPQTYQRTYKNSIKVEKIADDLFDCNYLMFQNTSYGNKWFYAFIDKVNYINDKCTEIEYTLDVMQSFLLDFEVGECFVEREHSITDLVGENTVPEKFSVSEYLVSNKIKQMSDIIGSEMYGALITTKDVAKFYRKNGTQYTPISDGISKLEILEDMPSLTRSLGIPNSLTIITGLAVDYDTDTPDSNYYEQAPFNSKVPNLNYILGLLSSGNLYYEPSSSQSNYQPLSYEDIIAVYVYPKGFSLKTACTDAKTEGFPIGYSLFNYIVNNNTMPTVFKGKNNSSDYSFSSVKNKKLLTSPYIKLQFCNHGSNKEYNFENFIGSGNTSDYGIKLPSFKIYGNKVGLAEFVIQPINYNFIGENRNELLQFSENPIALYSGNALASYLERNGSSMDFSILNSLLNLLGSVGTGIATSNPIPIMGGAISTATTINNTLAHITDLKNAPPPSSFNTSIPLFIIGAKLMGGILYSITINAEYARIIDDYFSMYGYATNRVKQPNIFAYFRNTSGYYIRPHWNYVKTNGAIIHPRTNYGLPAEAEKKIAQIVDNGITFWNDESEIGNYSLSNGATGTP